MFVHPFIQYVIESDFSLWGVMNKTAVDIDIQILL